jgi:ubiquinone biosynthesis monooxygenase Coq7
MCTELTHLQDFQAKLFEYGFRPSILRWGYWVVGALIGLFSRLRGAKAVLKTGIWSENLAIKHYDELLETVDWEEDVRQIVKDNKADEAHHIHQWQNLLKEAEGKT